MDGQFRLDVFLLQSSNVIEGQPHWATKKRPLLQYLPFALAEFIGDNFRNELRLPATMKSGVRAQWTVAELNFILMNCLVKEQDDGTHLKTFNLLEWESELCEGAPKARCATLKKFRGKIVQVL